MEENTDTLYDPDPARRRRRSTRRRGRVPPQLRSWVYRSRRRRGTSAPTRRRRRRTPLYHPQPRSYRVYHPAKRRRTGRRRYDFVPRGWFGMIETPLWVTAGSVIHNFLASRGIKIPFIPKTLSLGNIHISDLGLIGFLGGVGAKYFFRNNIGDIALKVGSGMLAEGFAAPQIEGVMKAGVSAAGSGGGNLGGSYIPLNAYS